MIFIVKIAAIVLEAGPISTKVNYPTLNIFQLLIFDHFSTL